MKLHRLTTEQVVSKPLEDVFAFFSDAHNLEELTPPWLSFEVLTPAPIQMGVGTIIDYRLRVHGLPMRWRSEITVWDPPHRFVDEQRRGPYRKWRHEHVFAEVGGNTSVRDEVVYAAPGWIVEPLVHRLWVRPDVERIFAYRSARLSELYGGCVATS